VEIYLFLIFNSVLLSFSIYHKFYSSSVKVTPCLCGMAHPLVVDGGDSFQTWRAAVNILNKQLHTAKKRLPSSIVLM
jgi:hypothetical protein